MRCLLFFFSFRSKWLRDRYPTITPEKPQRTDEIKVAVMEVLSFPDPNPPKPSFHSGSATPPYRLSFFPHHILFSEFPKLIMFDW